jgi:NADPH:quinone reductase-like Zn-dependent oxidoreductase
VGPGVDTVAVGDRVGSFASFSVNKYSVYGEYALLRADLVRPTPPSLTDEQGAAIFNSYVPMYLALLEQGGLRLGQNVLITAGASSTGQAALQIARAAGAQTIIGTTRHPEKRAALMESGFDHVIATHEEDVPVRVREITAGRGADLIVDPVGGALSEALAGAAAPDATLIIYGALDGLNVTVPVFALIAKALTIRGFTMYAYTGSLALGMPGNRRALERAFAAVRAGVDAGWLIPRVAKVFAFDQVVDAHRAIEKGGQIGKIILQV